MHLTRIHIIFLAALLTIVAVGSFSANGIFGENTHPTRATVHAKASTGATPAAGAPSSSEIDLVDIAFTPKNITIPANTPTVITLVNDGAAVHNFSIDELNVHSGDIQAGETTTVTIDAPAGDYTFYCSIPGHRTAGMVGTLTVS